MLRIESTPELEKRQGVGTSGTSGRAGDRRGDSCVSVARPDDFRLERIRQTSGPFRRAGAEARAGRHAIGIPGAQPQFPADSDSRRHANPHSRCSRISGRCRSGRRVVEVVKPTRSQTQIGTDSCERELGLQLAFRQADASAHAAELFLQRCVRKIGFYEESGTRDREGSAQSNHGGGACTARIELHRSNGSSYLGSGHLRFE